MKIGQVVDLLKVEFPALSISKVRYLEGEGLISPHRVGNGYRRYSQADLERLRYALAVQRDEYLPLHVIRERLARLDADGEAPAPAGIPGAMALPRCRSRTSRGVEGIEEAQRNLVVSASELVDGACGMGDLRHCRRSPVVGPPDRRRRIRRYQRNLPAAHQ